jgi:hypothetical protein
MSEMRKPVMGAILPDLPLPASSPLLSLIDTRDGPMSLRQAIDLGQLLVTLGPSRRAVGRLRIAKAELIPVNRSTPPSTHCQSAQCRLR